jgi:hypothetical protein
MPAFSRKAARETPRRRHEDNELRLKSTKSSQTGWPMRLY